MKAPDQAMQRLIPLLHLGGGARGGGCRTAYSLHTTSPFPSPPSGREGTRRCAVRTRLSALEARP